MLNTNKLYNYKILNYPDILKKYIIKKIELSNEFTVDRHLDKLLYIVSIFYSRNYCLEYYAEGIPLNNHKIRKLIGENSAEKFFAALIAWEVIVLVGKYSVGYTANKFMLTEKYRLLHFKRHKLYSTGTRHWLNKLIEDRYDDYGDKSETTIEKYQRAMLDKLKLSREFYLHFCQKYSALVTPHLHNQFQPEPQDFGIISIMYGDEMYSKRRPTGTSRLYTNLTNLKKEYRKYLRLNGKRLISIDIKGSQLFLGVFKIQGLIKMQMGKKANFEELPDDFKRFKQQILENEDIYKMITNLLVDGFKKDISYEDFERVYQTKRKKFKAFIFQFIWYCHYQHRNSNNTVFKLFKKEFPTVANALNYFKSKGKGYFSIELQKKEAKLILDKVGKKLMNKKIAFLTIHDSVVVTNDEDLKFAENVIEHVFSKEYGATPKLSVERY